MKDELIIKSFQNPKIKSTIKLKERKERDKTQLFLIEGYREVSRAIQGDVHLKTLFVCPDLFLGENEPGLIEKAKKSGAKVFVCSSTVFAKLSYRDRPDGLIAVAVQMQRTLKDLFPIANRVKYPLFVIAEGIEKPGNLGSILRSADGVGATAVIVCDRCTDIYNPNVVRASVGTLFTLPVIEAEGAETLIWLREKKIKTIATSPAAPLEYTEADLRGPVAIVVGTEQLGLSELWLNASDEKVFIPMKGVADSLNVATATTLMLYEVLRQRKPGFPLGPEALR